MKICCVMNLKDFAIKRIFISLFALLFYLVGATQEISYSGRVQMAVNFLASEELAGRKAGETGDTLAAWFIRDQFKNIGLKLLYENGLQNFSLVSSVETGDNNLLKFNDINFELGVDFLPYSFTANKLVTAPVVFAGYGFSIIQDSIQWNDYANIDIKGKWVLILKGDPEIDKPESVFSVYSEERAKVLTAQDNGAAGVLLVGGKKLNEKDELQSLFYDKNSSTYSIPVFQITRSVADILLKNTTYTIDQLEEKINASMGSIVLTCEAELTGSADIIQKTAKTYNVVGMLTGNDPILKNEFLVIGAHYDHLGMGGQGSGSRALDTLAIHYGADDNASGVAAVIEIAYRAVSEKTNRRSLIFALFGAEEMGLIGSTKFTSDPPIDLAKVVAMFNFDMVGRLDENTRSLSVGGSQTAIETEEILNRLNEDFNLIFSPEGSGPSDHAAFYMQNIPVFFVSTGAHGDYHTPADTPDKINYTGIEQVVNYIWSVIHEISNRHDKLSFQEAGSKTRRSRGGRLKVTLGVMPDFAGQEKSGLRIDAVTKGKPASLGGMLKGDIITAINGNPVGNIYDYMNRLNTLEEGQTISIDIIREGKPLVLILKL